MTRNPQDTKPAANAMLCEPLKEADRREQRPSDSGSQAGRNASLRLT
jgi:hypothetical protein